MIHPNEPPETPDWAVTGATCRECGKAWHAEPGCLAVPPSCVLGEN